MCMYLYVDMFIYIHEWLLKTYKQNSCVYMYLFMRISVCLRLICMYVCVCVCKSFCMAACMRIYFYLRIRACISNYILMYVNLDE